MYQIVDNCSKKIKLKLNSEKYLIPHLFAMYSRPHENIWYTMITKMSIKILKQTVFYHYLWNEIT